MQIFSDDIAVLCALELEIEEDGSETEKEAKKKDSEDTFFAINALSGQMNIPENSGMREAETYVRLLHFQAVPTPPPEG